MRQLIFLPIIAILLTGCGSGKKTQKTENQAVLPSWVQSRPISQSAYIGIGSASKMRSGSRASNIAKENALNDLASEISIQVQGNSFLRTTERNDNFQETYNSMIRTSTDERLEGYELVDTYEDSQNYFAYYRLSKAKYAQIKAERKRKAFELARSQFTSGMAAEDNGDFSTALNAYLRSMYTVRDFWGEDYRMTIGTDSVLLATEIYHHLASLMRNSGFEANPGLVELNIDNEFSEQVEAQFKNLNSGKGYSNVPIAYFYYGSTGKFQGTKRTNSNGDISLVVEDADRENPNNRLSLEPNMEEILNDENKNPLLRELLSTVNTAAKFLPIKVIKPVLYINSEESNLGNDLNSGGFAKSLEKRLPYYGLSVTYDKSEADAVLNVNGETRKGPVSEGFHVSYLDLQITLERKSDGKKLFETKLEPVKGLALNFEKAGESAYEEASKTKTRSLSDLVAQAIY